MSVLARDRTVTALRATGFNRRLGGLGLVHGAVAALAPALLLLVPVLAAWTADSRSSVSWLDAMSFAGDGWVLAHHGQLTASEPGVAHVVTFAPLLLTLLALWCTRRAAGALLREAEQEGRAAGPWWHVSVTFGVGYVATGVLLALLGATGPASPRVVTVLPGAVLVALGGFGWAVRREADSPAHLACARWWARVPSPVRRGLRPGVEAAAALLAVSFVLLVALVLLHAGRVGQVNGLLGPGIVGTVVLTVLQVAAAPNLTLLVAGWTSGATVHVGTASVSAGAVQTGVLPGIPALGAVPDAGALPVWARVAPAVVVLVGALAGARAASALTSLSPWSTKLLTAASAAGWALLPIVVLIWLAGAHVSAAPLATASVSPLVVPLVAGELAVGALLAAAVLHLIRVHRSHV